MDKRKIIDCLELQIAELEMLKSAYPKQEEFSDVDPLHVAHVNNYILGISEVLPKQLDYTLCLEIPDVEAKLELNISLPHNYPNVKPIVYARSTDLNRDCQNKLNSAISEFLISNHCDDELCMLSLINWLTINASKYFTKETKETIKIPNNKSGETFSRLWIYSHHIYNKDKRKEILSLGKDLNLSGFSLPGKPGIICVEGYTNDCDNFLQSVKQLSWKKLSLNHKELYELEKQSIDNLKYFSTFQELSFQVRKGPAREYHMDMGEFYKYLEEHNCSYAFEYIFGFEGHT